MTQDTQTLIAGSPEVVLKHRAVTRIMTGDTIHRLAITGITRFIPHRMAEIAVTLMAVNTGRVVILFAHSRQIGAVQLMTGHTVVGIRMHIEACGAALKFSCVALTTCLARCLFDQPLLTTGMGTVAIETSIGLGSDNPVAELVIERRQNLFMTA